MIAVLSPRDHEQLEQPRGEFLGRDVVGVAAECGVTPSVVRRLGVGATRPAARQSTDSSVRRGERALSGAAWNRGRRREPGNR